MTPRQIAVTLVALRNMLAEVAVARAYGDEDRAQHVLGSMDRVARPLPLWALRDPVPLQRVGQPATRRMEREGILATAKRIGYRP